MLSGAPWPATNIHTCKLEWYGAGERVSQKKPTSCIPFVLWCHCVPWNGLLGSQKLDILLSFSDSLEIKYRIAAQELEAYTF